MVITSCFFTGCFYVLVGAGHPEHACSSREATGRYDAPDGSPTVRKAGSGASNPRERLGSSEKRRSATDTGGTMRTRVQVSRLQPFLLKNLNICTNI